MNDKLIHIASWILLTSVASGANLAPELKEWKGSVPSSVFQKEQEGRTALGVRGTGQESVAWRSPGLNLAPGSAYALHFRVRATGAGSIISGLEGINRDFTASAAPSVCGFAFRVPDNGKPRCLRLGHWQLNGEAVFDAVELYPVQPIYRHWGNWVLGEGERVAGGLYSDTHSMSWQGSTIHRTLYKQNAEFNSNRWCFGPGASVIYKYDLPTQMQGGELHVNVSYHTAGSLSVSVSKDGQSWTPVSEAAKRDSLEVKLPAELFPSSTLYVRLQASGDKANLQVDSYSFRAQTKETAFLAGKTVLLEERRRTEGWDVATEGAEAGLLLRWTNRSESARKLELQVEADKTIHSTCAVRIPARGESAALVALDSSAPAAKPKMPRTAPLPLSAGVHSVNITVKENGNSVCEWSTELTCTVLSESAYGYRCKGDLPGLSAWWCESAWKVGVQRAVPTDRPRGILIEAARGEFEAAQVVLNAKEEGRVLLNAEVSELRGGKGRIPASAVSLYEVATVKVENSSDFLGEPGDYPDPLPPLVTPLKLPAQRNQALWVLVHVPEGTPAGDYDGELKLQTDQGKGKLPIQLHVFDFSLPKETHLRSGFGLGPHEIKRYHQLKTKDQEQAVYEKYLQSFAEHRIAPYSFYPHAPIQIRFEGKGAEKKVMVGWDEFDAAAKKYLDSGMFNAFMLHLNGLGGGTFFERSAGEFGGFKAGTPDYERLWGDYARQLESHLREKGWLKQAYIYWFDEPDKKDYDFVNEGMDRIKKHAPDLRRLLTKHPDGNLPGHVDIWCGLTPHWTPQLVQERRSAGEEVWWYICCGPKAPYIGEFTEHPATEMRLWPWQSWQYGVQGILIWETVYWSSSTAFPKSLQDPWQDAMAYVSGYGVAPGAKQFWGNCDGRYLYPPRRDPNQPQPPCLDGPVSSLRWENLRDGMEDYEYLYLLKQQIDRVSGRVDAKLVSEARALLVVPENISKDTTHFTADARPILEQRRKIAAMIEKLQRK